QRGPHRLARRPLRTPRNQDISPAGPCRAGFAVGLPHAAAVLPHHGLSSLATESLLEFRDVHHQTIHAILTRRVLVGNGIHAKVLRALVLTSPLSVTDKEPLVRGEAVTALSRFVFHVYLPGQIGKDQAAQVRHVLT